MWPECFFGGNIAHAAVGEFHGVSKLERTFRFDIEPKLAKKLCRIAQKHGGADLNGLHLYLCDGMLSQQRIQQHDLLRKDPSCVPFLLFFPLCYFDALSNPLWVGYSTLDLQNA